MSGGLAVRPLNRPLGAAPALFAACLLYFLLFRSYGFQVEDEGTLLFQIGRVGSGQIPYVDFRTGYTPGFFYLGALLFKLLGASTMSIRPLLAVLNALTATSLYVLARKAVGPWLAALPSLAWVAFLPLFPGEFASFNVPYPAWFATAAWMGLAFLLLAWTTGGRAWQLVAAGAVAGLAFAIKPNAGAYALAAATWVTLAFSRRVGALDRLAAPAASLLMAAGIWFAFGFATWSVDAAIHLFPVATVAWIWAGPLASRFARSKSPRSTVSLVLLATSFAATTCLWALPLLSRLGVDRFLGDVLLIGSNAAVIYYRPHPVPALYACVVVTAVLALAGGGFLRKRGRLSARTVAVLLALCSAALLAYLWRTALMPESLGRSVALQLENAAFWLAPLAHWGGILYCLQALRRGRSTGEVRLLALLLPLAVAMYLQLYPRTDFMHLMISVPVTVVVATVLLGRVVAWWTTAAGDGVERAGVEGAGAEGVGVDGAGVGGAGVGGAGVDGAGVDGAGGDSAGVDSAGVGSAGVGSAGVGSAGVGSAGVGSAGVGSAGVGSAGVDGTGAVGAGATSRGWRIVVQGLLAVGVAAVVVVQLVPALGSLRLAVRSKAWAVDTPAMRVRLEPQASDDLSAFGRAVDYLREHSRAGEAVLTFPALSGVLFAAGLTSPVSHDYWYPGRPDHGEEATMDQTLAAFPPRHVVTLNNGWSFFAGSPAYFAATRSWVIRNYRLAARFGRYDVLVRRSIASQDAAVRWQPSGPMDAAVEPLMAWRRQAARRWMSGLGGTEPPRVASLPAQQRDAILLLRSLRDGGDMRAAPWLVSGYNSKDDRVREEALRAMAEVVLRFEASTRRWANDFDPAVYRGPVARALSAARAWRKPLEPRAQDFLRVLDQLALRATREATVP